MPNKPLVAIVDDDEPMRRATSNLLESAGFATATFPDAEVASGSGISTVLITAYPDETTRLRARKAGVICFLAKPVPPEKLCECVRSALGKRLEPKV